MIDQNVLVTSHKVRIGDLNKLISGPTHGDPGEGNLIMHRGESGN